MAGKYPQDVGAFVSTITKSAGVGTQADSPPSRPAAPEASREFRTQPRESHPRPHHARRAPSRFFRTRLTPPTLTPTIGPSKGLIAMSHYRLVCALLVAVVAAVAVAGGSAAEEPKAAKPAEFVLSPFGIGSCHSSNWGQPANIRWIPQMAAIGITNHRTCNYGLERGRARGRQVDLGGAGQADEPTWKSQHIAFGGILVGNPKWSAKGTKGGLPVNNLAGLEQVRLGTGEALQGADQVLGGLERAAQRHRPRPDGGRLRQDRDRRL